jgi:hypothetical protein
LVCFFISYYKFPLYYISQLNAFKAEINALKDENKALREKVANLQKQLVHKTTQSTMVPHQSPLVNPDYKFTFARTTTISSKWAKPVSPAMCVVWGFGINQ